LKGTLRNQLILLRIFVVLLISMASNFAVRAQSGTIDSILSVHQFKEAAISPNGKKPTERAKTRVTDQRRFNAQSFAVSPVESVPGVTASFRDSRQIVLALRLMF